MKNMENVYEMQEKYQTIFLNLLVTTFLTALTTMFIFLVRVKVDFLTVISVILFSMFYYVILNYTGKNGVLEKITGEQNYRKELLTIIKKSLEDEEKEVLYNVTGDDLETTILKKIVEKYNPVFSAVLIDERTIGLNVKDRETGKKIIGIAFSNLEYFYMHFTVKN